MKILLAVDGSDYTKRMLAWLATHEELLAPDAAYSFITVVPPLPPHVTRYLDAALVKQYYGERADEVLKPIAEFARRHDWRFTTEAPVGAPAATIAAAATDGGYDLLVMGSHGQSAALSLLLGSVAQHVLASCSVPVLIVR